MMELPDFIRNLDGTQMAVISGILLAIFGKKLYPIIDPIAAMLGYYRKDVVPPGPSPSPVVPGPVVPVNPNPLIDLLPANIQAIIALIQSLNVKRNAHGLQAELTLNDVPKAPTSK